MNIGIPKETRPFEFRVGLSPAGVEILTQKQNQVYVEHEAGVGAGFSDREFENAGARIVYSPEEVFGRADLLLKVARPTKEELEWLRPGSSIAGLLHLASTRRDKVDLLLEKKITSIAYEQIELADGSLPVLRPFSEIGGSMCATIAARFLQCNRGGKGILLGGVPGVPPAEVVILGSGVVATYATKAFLGLGAHVTVVDRSVKRLRELSAIFGPTLRTEYSTQEHIDALTREVEELLPAAQPLAARGPLERLAALHPRIRVVEMDETARGEARNRLVRMSRGRILFFLDFAPVVFTSAKTGAGIKELLHVLASLAPNPAEGNPPPFYKGEPGGATEAFQAAPDAGKHVLAHVFKVMIDPFVGKVGVFRVHQGTVTKDSQLYIGEGRKPIKAGHLYMLRGKTQTEVSEAVPGDICAIAKIDEMGGMVERMIAESVDALVRRDVALGNRQIDFQLV